VTSILLAGASVALFVLGVEVFYRIFPGAIPRGIEHLARARVYAYDRDLGIALRPDVDERIPIALSGQTVRVHTRGNGRLLGFRDDGFQGGLRIAILGDSYVFGYGVDQGETFAARLEERLRRRGIAADVINAGVPGYAGMQERILLEKHVLPLHPALVLVGVYENDVRDSVELSHKRWRALRSFLGAESVIYNLMSAARAARSRAADASGLERKKARAAGNWEEGYRIQRDEIARMHALCERAGVRFGVILLPASRPLDRDRFLPREPPYPVLDLSVHVPEWDGLREKNPYVGHLTSGANAKVAEVLDGFIETHGLLSE
jgi:hypothetical protein